MTLCDLSYPPDNCIGLIEYIECVAGILAGVNAIRCGEDDHEPSDVELDALWGTCDPPAGALVEWWNTNTVTGSQWVTTDGSAWEQVS